MSFRSPEFAGLYSAMVIMALSSAPVGAAEPDTVSGTKSPESAYSATSKPKSSDSSISRAPSENVKDSASPATTSPSTLSGVTSKTDVKSSEENAKFSVNNKSAKTEAKSDTKSDDPKKVSTATIKRGKSKLLDTPPCLNWLDPDVDPKAVIMCVHGLGLHNGTYKDFGERMARLGYAVYAVDVRGFGSYMASKDRSRQKMNFESCLDDVSKTLHFIHKVHPTLPVFLLGESMGGGIALRVTSEHPELVDGLISSVPAGDRFHQGKTNLLVAFKLLTSPNKEFDVGTGVINQATEKSGLKEMWSQDKFARLNLSARELCQFQSFMNDNHKSVKLIKKTPVLMVQGRQDKLVNPKGTRQLYDNIVCKDKEMMMVDNAEHLIFEEGQFDEKVIQKVDKWVSAHLTKQDSGQISSK